MGVRLRLDDKALTAVLQSPAVQSVTGAEARRLAARAGDGFGVYTSVTSRARAYVRAETYRARRQQARGHVLERVYGGAR